MTQIPVPALNVHLPGHELLAPGLPEERWVLTEEARFDLPKGTITIGADDCLLSQMGWEVFRTWG